MSKTTIIKVIRNFIYNFDLMIIDQMKKHDLFLDGIFVDEYLV